MKQNNRAASMPVAFDVDCARSDGEAKNIGVDRSVAWGRGARQLRRRADATRRARRVKSTWPRRGLAAAERLRYFNRRHRARWTEARGRVANRAGVLELPTRHRSMSDQTYDEGRARNLEALLLALAARIAELGAAGELLANAGELTRLIGDVRSELFHYEVRATYDTPEVADSRRIVAEAKDTDQPTWEQSEWTPEDEDETEW
ncbi:MAG: hypothetical protein NVS4B3_15280 [Gemmatimonadaceae bacterium]